MAVSSKLTEEDWISRVPTNYSAMKVRSLGDVRTWWLIPFVTGSCPLFAPQKGPGWSLVSRDRAAERGFPDSIFVHPWPTWLLGGKKARTLLSQPYLAICCQVTCPNSVNELWNQNKKTKRVFPSLNYTHTFVTAAIHVAKGQVTGKVRTGSCRGERCHVPRQHRPLGSHAVLWRMASQGHARKRELSKDQTWRKASFWACESRMTSKSLTEWGSRPLTS